MNSVKEPAGSDKDAWLFCRNNQSIYVTRLPLGMTLLVCGPGHSESSHHFQTVEALDEFWRWYRRHLLAEEWVLSTTPDRRSRDRDGAGGGPERRRRPRE